ncbi:50S ribosomal protein L35 [candidate division WWE3 bacterium]|nr:50S ribosomal protein L35 [candidate division WWE3 bacterium]
MGKLKTRKTLAKRVKLTGSGKILRKKVTAKHLRVKLNSNRKHRSSQELVVNRTFSKKLKEMLPKVRHDKS